MKTILVLTDFTIRAGYAAEFALHIALKNKSNLLLCHAIESTSRFSNKMEFDRLTANEQVDLKYESIMDLKETGNSLKKLIKESNTFFKPEIKYIAAFGMVADVAEKVINEKQIDLVVIGSHRSNRLSNFLSGSHIHALLDQLKCPLLLVPECLRFRGINTIGYASDLTFNNTKVMNYLVKIAQPFDANISINYVSTIGFPATASEKENDFSLRFHSNNNHPPISYHNMKGDNVKKTLLDITRSGQVDILTVVHKRYNFLDRLLGTSVSKWMTYFIQIPLLILPDSFVIS
jgi:nucleotide-binding universal stress UspA family protein